MCTGADLAGVVEEDFLLDGRVVEEAEGVVAATGVGVEEGGVEVHAEGDGAHDFDV